MSTLHQIRQGFSKAWDSFTEGWREFRDLAGDALTRFQPKTARGDVETAEDRIVSRASRWGLLAAEVADNDDSVQVMLEAPGLDAEDFDIEVRDDILVVRGEKKLAREETRGQYHVMERAYGQFERAIRLPSAVEDDGAKANYRAGVLTIILPKSRTARPRRIAVDRK
ncbi:MAG TPA: Hsp20/alpha crystallin family protein [Woeseiaceae bacterium]|nr:Hsp20/alpha crystallin family protein [Woeseiaceae bacterium]